MRFSDDVLQCIRFHQETSIIELLHISFFPISLPFSLSAATQVVPAAQPHTGYLWPLVPVMAQCLHTEPPTHHRHWATTKFLPRCALGSHHASGECSDCNFLTIHRGSVLAFFGSSSNWIIDAPSSINSLPQKNKFTGSRLVYIRFTTENKELSYKKK